jgi:hypothetical protein
MNQKMKAHSAAIKNAFTGIGGALAAAFSVRAIANFSKEAMKLSASMEGIKKGFDQIGNKGLLEDLRKATHNTVTDMQLMATAVKASNFQIPLNQLAKLLEFASARAIQTGQSVDYLVESIIMGIGRKSPLILDNLGISAVRLREVLKGAGAEVSTVADIAGAVGKIAAEELAKMGGMAETTAVKFQQFTVVAEELKTAWGNYLNQNELIKTLLENTKETLTRLSDPELNFWQKLMWSGKKYEEWASKGKPGKNTGMSVGGFEDLIKLGAGGGKPSINNIIPEPVIGPYDEMVQKIKEAAEESRKMSEAWKIIHKEIAGTGLPLATALKESDKGIEKYQKLYLPVNTPTVPFKLPNAAGLAPKPKMPEVDITDPYKAEIDMVNKLQSAFEGMANSALVGGKVLEDMAKSMIASIKQIAAEILAKAAVWAILRVIFPGLFGTLEMGSFSKFVTGGLLGGGKALAMGAQNIKIGGQFQLKGADLYASAGRFGNMLNGST